jgi:CRISPR system Cascade subunit CasD
MTGLLLHLAGPMQSWGSQSHWSRRDTHDYPTRSGLIGLFGAALGYDRGHAFDEFAVLAFSIRIDRPGSRLVDFQTAGGGRPAEQTPPLAGGGRRPQGKGTIVSHRHYLSDAAFTVAATCDDETLLQRITDGLIRPRYAPYLGRRSCPPTAVFFLGQQDDPVRALHEDVPLARVNPRDQPTVAVDFVTEVPPAAGVVARTEVLSTQPATSHGLRAFEQHTTWRTTHQLPVGMCGGLGTDFLASLASARESATPA